MVTNILTRNYHEFLHFLILSQYIIQSMIKKCRYKDTKLYIYYRHKNNNKCLVFSNVKSFKSVFSELYCYDSLLKKLEINEFSNMINRNYKDNEVYIIDGLWMRYIIKFND